VLYEKQFFSGFTKKEWNCIDLISAIFQSR